MKQKGFSLIELLIVVVIIGIIASIAIPNLLAARRSANNASAMASLRVIFSAEITYKSSGGSGNYGTLSDLYDETIIDKVLSDGNKSGFKFDVVPTDASATFPAVFDAYATAVIFGSSPTATSGRNFYTNETGVVYENSAGQDNPPDATSNTDRTVINGTPITGD